MKTTAAVAERLHELMLYDLLASEVYFIQAALFRNWGYSRLAEHLAHEAEHERLHAKKQLDRLLYLGVPVELGKRPTASVGGSPRECLSVGLEMERAVAAKLNQLCAACREGNDAGTRTLADELLEETEMDHILWLETQLRLIEQLGEQRYLAEHV
jgi:bacterioferritin